MATEIKVPVRLEVLLESISAIKSTLANLKPDSSGWRTLNTILQNMIKEADKLLIAMSKPFTSLTLFNAAEKSIEKMEEGLDKARLAMSRIKFSDIKLTPELTDAFEALKAELKSIELEIKLFKVNAKAMLQDSPVWDDIIKLDPNAATRTFDDLLKVIRRKNSELQLTMLDAELALNKFNADLTKRDATQNLIDGKKFKDLLGDLYSNYFKTNDYFKNEDSKSAFFDWVKNNFVLSDELIELLKSASGPKLDEVIQNMKDSLKARLNELKLEGETRLTNYDEATGQAASALRAAEAMGQAVDDLANKQATLKDRQELVVISTRNLEESLVNGARSNELFDASTRLMGSLLENLKSTLVTTNALFLLMLRTQLSFNLMKMAVVNFMGFNLVLNLTKSAIREAINHIRELDSVMNKISIVTDMSTSDLWDQVDAYSKMALAYGVSIKGAYEVSQIYYQLGLLTADVLTLTNETLKLAKISGLDYATTTDYMTTALRGFKMEMSEASRVVDVYSNLASHTAVSLEELAVAMSKTASSMEAVGATFEEASAMIGTMVAVTRESATNIGSAMKSIASRYGELTKDPTKLVDEEGEAMAFNKVDAALQSVGISMRTVDGLFREFTDVIIELGEKWDLLDSVQLRYIATLFAGNRQQSRFLALISNVDLLKSNLNYAENSEDTGTLQALKALDSVEAKIEQVRVAYLQFYTTLGAENVWKGLLDGTKNVINTLNSLPKLFGKIPLGAIAAVSNVIVLIKQLLTRGIQGVASIWTSALSKTGGEATTQGLTIGRNLMQSIEALVKAGTPAVLAALNAALSLLQLPNNSVVPLNNKLQLLFRVGTTNLDYKNWNKLAENYAQNGMMSQAELASALKAFAAGNENAYREAVELSNAAIRQLNGLLRENTNENNNNRGATDSNTSSKLGFFEKLKDGSSALNRGLSATAMAFTTVGMVLDKSSAAGRTASGVFTSLGGVLLTGASAARLFAGDWSALPLLVMGVINVINGFSIAIETPAERLERLKLEAEELNNLAKEAKANYRTLDNSIKKIDELKEKRYESAEATEEYLSAVDDLASKFPQLIGGFDEAGNIILDTTDAERILAEARLKSKEATYAAAKADMDAAKEKADLARKSLSEMSISMPSLTALESLGQAAEKFAAIYKDISKKDLPNAFLSDDPEVVFNEIMKAYSSMSRDDKLSSGYGFLEGAFYKDDEGKRHYSLDTLLNYLNENSFTSASADNFKEAFFGTNTKEQLEARLSELIKKFNALVTDESADAEDIFNTYDLINQLGNLAKKSNWFDSDSIKAMMTSINAAGEEIKVWSEQNDIYTGYEKQVISAWLLSANANAEAWDILSNSSTAAAMVTKKIKDEILNKYNNNYDEAVASGAEELWKEYQDNMANFIKLLSPEDLEIFNKMTSDTNSYSALDIIEKFNIKDNNILQYIIDYYSSGIESILTRLNNVLSKSLGKSKDSEGNYLKLNISDLKGRSEFYKKYFDIISQEDETNLSIIDELYLNLVLKLYDKLKNNGYNLRAENFGNAALSLFEEIGKAPSDIEKLIFTVINDSGLSTLEAIEKIKDIIKTSNANLLPELLINADTIINILESNIISNINLEIQTATSDLLENWEDTSKEVSKAMSSGLELKEADQLITKAESLGLKLDIESNFVQNGDKLVLTSEAFNNYWRVLNEKTTTLATLLLSNINLAMAALGKGEQTYLNENDKAAILAIAPNFDFSKYLNDYGSLTNEGIVELSNAIGMSQESLLRYLEYNRLAAESVKNAFDWSLGDYSSYSDDLLKLKELASGKIELKKDDYNAKSIKNNINSAYDTLISDVLSKGFDNINLADYEGLIASDELALKAVIQQGDYLSFVRLYAEFAGKTIDETNDLLLQAIEKLRELTSEDLIKDFTFLSDKQFRADYTQLGKLANAFDKPLSDLLNSAAVIFDETTQEYVVNIEKLKDQGIDLTAVDNFKLTVQESVDSMFNALASEIKNALGGSLDAKGVKTLTDDLLKMGINASLHFTKTKDGYKLAVDEVLKLYDELKSVDALTALIVLDELNKSIEDSVTNTKKLKGEIAELRATTESDDFKFMDKDIPSGQNNPLNYFNNWYKAFEAWDAAGKGRGQDKGKIAYEDFYNIITEMGNLAETSNQVIPIGNLFVSNALDAAALIQKGAAALSVASDGTLKVDLGKLGVDFSAGSEDLKKNVTEGIKSIAQSEIDMLDSMILLLETIVAMEDLGNLAGEGGDKETIEIEDILPDIEFDDKGNATKIGNFSESYDKWVEKIKDLINEKSKNYNEDLAKAVKNIKIDDISFEKILGMSPEDLAGKGKDFLDKYAAVMDAFWKAAKSDNYDLNNIWASVKEVLAGSNKNYVGDIDIGDMHLTFTNGVVLERVDGGYKVGDKVYKDADKATQATYAADIKAMEDAARTYNENGSVTYNGVLNYTVSYDLASKTYTVDFGDSTATSATKEGIEFAIATYAKLNSKEISSEKGENSEGVSFTLHQAGDVKVEVTLKDGKVTTDDNDTNGKIKDAALAAADKEAQEAAAAVEGTTGTATVNNLNIKLATNSLLTIDLDGLIIEATGVPSTIISGIKIIKDSSFSIDGDNEIWSELVTTKEGQEFIAYVLKLITNEQEGFTNDNGEAIWAKIVNTKEGQEFIAYIKSLSTLQGTNFTNDEGKSIWNLVDTTNDSYEFLALVIKLITEQGTNFTNDDGVSIWSLVTSDKAYEAFIAKVASLITQLGDSFSNDNGETIWSAVNISKEYAAFYAKVKSLVAEWASNASKTLDEKDLTLPSEVVSTTPITLIKPVDVQYELSNQLTKAIEISKILGTSNYAANLGYNEGWAHLLGMNRGENAHAVANYVVELLKMVKSGQQLSKIDISNLEKLGTVGDLFKIDQLNGLTLGSVVSEILALNTVLLENNNPTEWIEALAGIAAIDGSGILSLAEALTSVAINLETLKGFDYEGLALRMALLVVPTAPISENPSGDTETGSTTIVTYEANTKPMTDAAEAAKKEATKEAATEEITGDGAKAVKEGEDTKAKIDAMSAAITITATNSASSVINSIKSALNNLVSGGPYNVTVKASVQTSGDSPARGTIGLALAGGTLMGELGPELVVSSGRYFVVGQNGPEMVNLADDAIVFNHLQTKSLLEKGTSPTRGKAITNERIAASYAKGNIDGGPAMASASAALAALKQLRAQWQALLGMSAKDLAGKGGGGGGGGSSTDPKAFTTELEKWYNWLQKIDELEKDINRYEAERNRNASSWNKNGKLYYNSLMQSLEALKQLVDITADLVNSQTEYFNLRRAELNSSKNPYSTLYTFDEYGQLRYKDGRLEEMSKLVGRNEYGKANMTAELQYKELIKLVPSQYLDYDSSGNKIDKSKDDWYVTAVESFWNRVDADKEEMQGLFDSINDNTIKINNLLEELNKLLEEMRDNLMEVEDMIMDSLVEMRLRVIDNMSKERERLLDSSEKYLSGLSDALNKEKDMYLDLLNEEETRKLLRQLAILRRSGGSGAEIRNLEEQLRNRLQDAYFEQQLKLIDAIQEASDKELERLETQITIAQETLDYQKEMGLLWQEVYEIMAGTPESIASFIESNNPERWGESNLRSETDYRDTLFKAELWAAYRDDTRTHEELAMPLLKSIATGDEEKRILAEVDAKLKEQNEKNASTTTTTTTTTNNNNNNNNNKALKKEDNKQWHATATAAFYNEKGLQSYLATAAHKNKSMAESNAMYYAKRKGHGSFYSPGSGVKSSYYKKGGIIDYTGLAWVDGSKGNPEGILNAELMDLLRNEILGTKNNSLVNLLLDFKNTYDTLGSNYISSINNSGITIENATVEMHVDQISNDYDARRAGEQALSEIMRIARKTSAKNSVGR